MPGERRLHLAQLDAEAAHLHLRVGAAGGLVRRQLQQLGRAPASVSVQ